ncbi:MAG: hypothetical protein DI582_09955 [Azospirillum brasilense]|nr:MAG: hypothetical protein DI582_09955 [Azospirillum brasilense]
MQALRRPDGRCGAITPMLCANTAILAIDGGNGRNAGFRGALLDAGVVEQRVVAVAELAAGEVAAQATLEGFFVHGQLFAMLVRKALRLFDHLFGQLGEFKAHAGEFIGRHEQDRFRRDQFAQRIAHDFFGQFLRLAFGRVVGAVEAGEGVVPPLEQQFMHRNVDGVAGGTAFAFRLGLCVLRQHGGGVQTLFHRFGGERVQKILLTAEPVIGLTAGHMLATGDTGQADGRNVPGACVHDPKCSKNHFRRDDGLMTLPSPTHWQRALDEACRSRFDLFFRRVVASVSPGVHYLHNWHIDAMAAHLHACARGDITRLIINLPPRMMKSTLVSVAWPAWLLGHDPQRRIMAASYAQSLATKHSTDCRLVMQRAWYQRVFPETRLSDDQNEKERFVTTKRGHRLAVSVGGAAVGEGGTVLIVDDPLNPLQANHRTQRDAANAWFDHSFATRLDDKQRGAIVVVMQRLHAQDLSGYLLEKGGWEHLCLPATAPTRTQIQCGDWQYVREAGEVLHAAREPAALLARTATELGSLNYAAQYQQAPVAQAGQVIPSTWLPRYTQLPQGGRTVQSWDTGIKAGAQHDASVCLTMQELDGVHYVRDVQEVRMEYPALKRFMLAQAERYAPEAILVEDKASGQSLLQDLRHESDWPWIAQQPQGDKQARLLRVSPMLEAGKVKLPADAPWLADFQKQLLGFPDAAHDDMVDALSQYLNWVRGQQLHAKPFIRRV